MMNLHRQVAALGMVSLALSQMAAAEIVIVGGRGLNWEAGGGNIPATVIRTATTVEVTNAPGAVIDFDVEGRPDWIFPKRADPQVNIAVGVAAAARGGSIKTPNNPTVRPQLINMIDDNGATALDLRPSVGLQGATVLGTIIDIDLGARFGVNRFRFFPRNADPDYPAEEFPHQSDFMRGYEIFVNDGSPATQRDGVPIRETAIIESQNSEAIVDRDIAARYVRHIRLKSLTSRGFEIAEFQIFATGFVPEARFVSNVFDFGERALLGNLRWVQEQTGGLSFSGVAIRTRAGDDPQPVEFTRIRPGARAAGEAADEVPWRAAADVEELALSELIEQQLDNSEIDVRDAIAIFASLPLADQSIASLDGAAYRRLNSSQKGVIREDLRNWSDWSPPHAATAIVDTDSLLEAPDLGSPIGAVVPRQYFQFAIDFSSEDLNAATGIGGLAFDLLSPPYADALIAEITPRRTGLGEQTRFTYALLSKSATGQTRGFDSVEIETPLRIPGLGRVLIEAPDGSDREADFSDVALGDGTLPQTRGDITIAEVREDGFILTFPPILEGGTLLKVEFDNAVLRFGTTFLSRVRSSDSDFVLWQDALAGNAADLGTEAETDPDLQPAGTVVPGNLSVAVPVAEKLLIEVQADPPVVTPNADGVNDIAMIRYDITSVTRASPVEVDIFDLAGRLVRSLYRGDNSSGRFARAWDGTDDAGRTVPPGNYLLAVRLHTRAEAATEIGIISVAY